nr:ultraviolet-B receptor UVR8-like [Ipomoea batatas]
MPTPHFLSSIANHRRLSSKSNTIADSHFLYSPFLPPTDSKPQPRHQRSVVATHPLQKLPSDATTEASAALPPLELPHSRPSRTDAKRHHRKWKYKPQLTPSSWGRNQNGQLGLGTIEDSLVPHKIETFQGVPVKMVVAGAKHTWLKNFMHEPEYILEIEVTDKSNQSARLRERFKRT